MNAIPTTSKQFGDAGEHYVLSQLFLVAGIPAVKMPDNWPGYDLIAAPAGRPSTTISVKARHEGNVSGNLKFTMGEFDWLAVVMVADHTAPPRLWLIPRKAVLAESSDLNAANRPNVRRITYRSLKGPLAHFENNLALDPDPVVGADVMAIAA